MLEDVVVEAPGRINFLGGHTDYNDGFVLPAAIDKRTTVRIKKNGDPLDCQLYTENLNSRYSFSLDHLDSNAIHWAKYALGVVSELQQLGAELTGFDCAFTSDIPLGAGLSSSSSLECAIASGLNDLFELGLDNFEIMKLAQRAEHNFVGTKCGLMDQFTCLHGKKSHALLLDCRSLDYEYIPINLVGYKLILLDTKVSHSLAFSEYNTRREECETGVSILKYHYPHINALRDVSAKILEEHEDEMSPTVFKRCQYVVDENNRVLKAAAALKNGNIEELGRLMFLSHDGYNTEYEVSCDEADFLIELAKKNKYVLGGRLMGGGFGGTTLNIVKNEGVNAFIEEANSAYFEKFGHEVENYTVHVEDGLVFKELTQMVS